MPMGTHTPGPEHLFVRFRGAVNIFYVGTCVADPKFKHQKSRIPIMNDLAGRSEPFQVIKDGEHAIIVAVMNRFDYQLWQTIRALDSSNSTPVSPTAGNALVGQEGTNVRGTLVLGITDFQLIVWKQYYDTTAAGTANAEPIRQYSSVELIDYDEDNPDRAEQITCVMKSTSLYNLSALSFAGGTAGATYGLYSENRTQIGVTVADLLAIVAAATG